MKILATISAIAALALGTGQALAASSHHNAAPRTLKVVMHDPGCHWFLVHGKVTRTASLRGPIRLQNFDEAALKVASRSGAHYIKIGRSLVLHRGHYVVMMVGQAPDDNYLKLTVR
jgi:hypothetical protein